MDGQRRGRDIWRETRGRERWGERRLRESERARYIGGAREGGR